MEVWQFIILTAVSCGSAWSYFDAVSLRDRRQLGIGPGGRSPERWGALTLVTGLVGLPLYLRARAAATTAPERSGPPPRFVSGSLEAFGVWIIALGVIVAVLLGLLGFFGAAAFGVVIAAAGWFGGRRVETTGQHEEFALPTEAHWDQAGFRRLDEREPDDDEPLGDGPILDLDRAAARRGATPSTSAGPNPSAATRPVGRPGASAEPSSPQLGVPPAPAPPHRPAPGRLANPAAPKPPESPPAPPSTSPPPSLPRPGPTATEPGADEVVDLHTLLGLDEPAADSASPAQPRADALPTPSTTARTVSRAPASVPPTARPSTGPTPPHAARTRAVSAAPPLSFDVAPQAPLAHEPLIPPEPGEAGVAPAGTQTASAAGVRGSRKGSARQGVRPIWLVAGAGLAAIGLIAWLAIEPLREALSSQPVNTSSADRPARSPDGPEDLVDVAFLGAEDDMETEADDAEIASEDRDPVDALDARTPTDRRAEMQQWLNAYDDAARPLATVIEEIDFEGFDDQLCAEYQEALLEFRRLPDAADPEIDELIKSSVRTLRRAGAACRAANENDWALHVTQTKRATHVAQRLMDDRYAYQGPLELELESAEGQVRSEASMTGRFLADNPL